MEDDDFPERERNRNSRTDPTWNTATNTNSHTHTYIHPHMNTHLNHTNIPLECRQFAQNVDTNMINNVNRNTSRFTQISLDKHSPDQQEHTPFFAGPTGHPGDLLLTNRFCVEAQA